MVVHGKIRPVYDYVCDNEQSRNAKKLFGFINSIQPELRVYCYQYPSDESYTCWYVGFADKQNPYILHFNITKKGLDVWFRRPEYLSDEGKLQTTLDQNYRKMTISDLNSISKRIIVQYIGNIREPLLNGDVKIGHIHKKCQVEII